MPQAADSNRHHFSIQTDVHFQIWEAPPQRQMSSKTFWNIWPRRISTGKCLAYFSTNHKSKHKLFNYFFLFSFFYRKYLIEVDVRDAIYVALVLELSFIFVFMFAPIGHQSALMLMSVKSSILEISSLWGTHHCSSQTPFLLCKSLLRLNVL